VPGRCRQRIHDTDDTAVPRHPRLPDRCAFGVPGRAAADSARPPYGAQRRCFCSSCLIAGAGARHHAGSAAALRYPLPGTLRAADDRCAHERACVCRVRKRSLPVVAGGALAHRRCRCGTCRSAPTSPSGARPPLLFRAAWPSRSAERARVRPIAGAGPTRSRRSFFAAENRGQGHATVCWPVPEFHAAALAHVDCGLV
jgi:hypothetical protein